MRTALLAPVARAAEEAAMSAEEPAYLSQDLLNRLEQRWRDQGALVARALRPGLADSEMDELTEPIGLRLPVEARRWWRWHDGAEPEYPGGPPAHLGPGKYFLSLADAVKECQKLREMQRYAWGEDLGPYWRAGWLPLYSSDRPIMFDCAVGPEEPVPVRSIFFEDPTAGERGVRSIGELVTVWIGAIDCGAWQWLRSEERWDSDWTRLDREVALLHLT